HPNERQNAYESLRRITCLEINALVMEDPLENRAPAVEMEVRPIGLRSDETIPLASGTGETTDSDCHRDALGAKGFSALIAQMRANWLTEGGMPALGADRWPAPSGTWRRAGSFVIRCAT